MITVKATGTPITKAKIEAKLTGEISSHTHSVDDIPVNGAATDPISSNWAFDHLADADPHSVYVLQSHLDDHVPNTYNGFDRQDATTLGTITFNESTRVFTIDVEGGETDFSFWCSGTLFTKTSSQTVTIPDTTGTYYVYFDNSGVLQYVIETSISDAVFYQYAIVGLVYWNATAGEALVGDERHGFLMDSATHEYLHKTEGAQYEDGLSITGLSDGVGTYTNTTSGTTWDEDIEHTHSLQTTHQFLYRLGSTGEWTKLTADANLGHTQGGDTRVSYNQDTGATWQLTELAANEYMIMFFISFGSYDSTSVFKILGQGTYASRAAARAAIESELDSLNTAGLPSAEMLFIGAVILDNDGTLVELADGSEYLDLRTSSEGGGSVSGSTSVAADVTVDTTNFDSNLSVTDSDLQTALETLDDMTVGSGTDSDAIHDNVANEISALTEKSSPANSDILIIEDSAASYVKKKVQITNLPSGGGSGGLTWTIVTPS